ncbi:ATP-binding protein [Natronoflexus pectinivorans]|uniref:histidine kinase n=1 Tax=Natronoflexus pectinivorans TaxID=682526 RepID=A0A4R2GJD1_9BACT|nr:ATP-binding protein [Natronoflexus pectinivorans]TCO08423.1 signal transduction histidine kinase [Natronoflexus pectinivorans]
MSKTTKTYIRHLHALINRHLGPSSLPGEGIQYWRQRIFHYFSLAIVFFGVTVYLYYGLYFLFSQDYHLLAFSTFIFISSLLMVSLPGIPLKIRSGWVQLMLFITGTFLLFLGPHTNIGMIFLFACSIMAVTMSGTITAIRYMILHSIVLTAVGFYWYSGRFQLTNFPDISLHTYINLAISFMVLNTITLAPLISLINGLMFSIKKERRYQRILEKEQDDLVLARQKAEESDKLKTAFLSNMSHEIRTPMNAILGFSNLLSHKGVSDQEKKEFVNLIRINANNLMSLVEDIIDISKMESGQFELHNSPCQLHQLLDETNNIFEEEIFRRGITNVKLYLKKGLADENLQILTDGIRLKKVLANLIGNAIKFTHKGYVEFGYVVKNHHQLEFYVKDTGIGLPEGTEELIFNRFYKCSNNSEKLYGGTGIGLTIARHLVRYMGGDIRVDSRSAVGTTFYFTIPFQKVLVPLQNQVKPWLSDSINWEGKTFLVAEDEEDNFRYLEVALSLFNASLIWARDGREAVDILQKVNQIDLVLMDIKMPVMDGYTAVREIRKFNKTVPVIAQTAYTMRGEKAEALKAGCNEYISKPINYNELVDMIKQFIPDKMENQTQSQGIVS